MLSFAQVMAILAFTGAVIASPAPEEGTTFSLHPISGSASKKHGLDQLIEVRRRAGVEVHPKLVEAAENAGRRLRRDRLASRSTGRRVAGASWGWSEDKWDTEYLYPVQIGGKNGKTFRSSIGTAAADFWCHSSAQPTEQNVGYTYYEINPAHQKVGSNYSIGYNGAQADSYGNVYVEDVTIGGITTKQAFGAASGLSQTFLSDPDLDCMVGIGNSTYNSIVPEYENNFFDNIMKQLVKPVFAYAQKKGGAVFDFGFFDQNQYTGKVAWVDNAPEDGWPAYAFYGEGFSLFDPNAKVTPRKMNIHLDASTTLSYTDPDIVTAWYKSVPGSQYDDDQQMHSIPCNSKPGGFTIVIGGQKFFTPGDQLVSIPLDDEGKTCLGGLQNIGGGVDFSLFGMTWLKGKYIMHDFANPKAVRLGFAMQPGATH
ncbi:hypothetical protein COCC4DRAFT_146565 [Bipolaris maydis ATCC 48331]|uniref:Peptidase A1 domain-containing protein n=1 Tax=Cochliobolus heterostrophus (strain C4 / ATCC 48331 / race T) TaxID=665024 RepID=N4WNK9_COCH4|nr:uncharacterized protein COCC4DRAFT_146565 [Bipolaris maydis ATCC 48331]KAH7562817.1 hypothetical protein BM1_02337 [Bipolaris maydis]ENI02024.1 hypothetical protein COCC4DRAFT_146565 [Bipolaris maydis ATCC 48331]KAJ5028203.1 aspartic peptidase domain-containing protein [Bipolaris maydis]KAJ5062980.1 aspartic peptidase domain-containing protein [Bipolaris maydis]KAJ6203946.1 aspartic peptidase domain-containing protein [Bipolaris maydis]